MTLYDDFGTVPCSTNNGIKIYSSADSKSGFNIEQTFIKSVKNRFLTGLLFSTVLILLVGLISYLISKD